MQFPNFLNWKSLLVVGDRSSGKTTFVQRFRKEAVIYDDHEDSKRKWFNETQAKESGNRPLVVVTQSLHNITELDSFEYVAFSIATVRREVALKSSLARRFRFHEWNLNADIRPPYDFLVIDQGTDARWWENVKP